MDDQAYEGWDFTGDSGSWVATTFDLSDVPGFGDLRGEPQVWLSFLMTSDVSVGDGGVFIDNVRVRKQTGAKATD